MTAAKIQATTSADMAPSPGVVRMQDRQYAETIRQEKASPRRELAAFAIGELAASEAVPEPEDNGLTETHSN